MLKIEFLNETVFGEPGPNLIIQGDLSGILHLQSLLKKLIDSSISMNLINSGEVEIIGANNVCFSSNDNGVDLLKVDTKNNNIIINIPSCLWEKCYLLVKPLETHSGHNFFEFDDEDHLREDANIIIQSIID